MIGAWMIYILLTTGLISGFALATERAARAYRRPTRWIWIGAIVASFALPALRPTWVISRPMAERPGWSSVRSPAHAGVMLELTLQRLNVHLTRGWLMASLGMGALTLASLAGLMARSRRWRPGTVAGCPVAFSTGDGPGVAGVWRSTVIVPNWITQVDERSRGLVVAHELEHIRGRDPLLLLIGIAGVIVMPWNLFLWWQLRRLRLAVEVDCDARVLARRPADTRAYGELLLEVARRAAGLRLPIPAFSESGIALETRIRAMTASPVLPRHRTQGAYLLAVGILLMATATWLPNPLRLQCAEPVPMVTAASLRSDTEH